MTRTKLPPATDWQAREIDTWNTQTFLAYLSDKHRSMFGIDYVPFGGWAKERGMIAHLIGTKSGKNRRPRTAGNADVKRFIDECMANYVPNKKYPGINFGFMWSYRKIDWQRIQAEGLRKAKTEQAVEESDDMAELGEWF